MSESSESWLELEVETELEKLFALQGQSLSKEKKAIWIQELISSRLPMKAILQGIRSIKGDDLGRFTFATLKGAAKKFVVEAEIERGCDKCMGGFTVVKDSAGRAFARSCTCDQGRLRGHRQGTDLTVI